jgi:hypothetical protein
MKNPKAVDSQDCRQFLAELARRWPLAKGCLSEVRKPCIRPRCAACARGEKHPAFLFSFREQGRQRCLYVPRELVPRLRQAIENGRWMEARLVRLGSSSSRPIAERARRPGPRGPAPNPDGARRPRRPAAPRWRNRP